ncbi:MAG: MBL fold metallo-hydrolase [Desulfovibrio sp.]|nr:MBL fold metallo-hydrolase [Desulfovibrio sp.]
MALATFPLGPIQTNSYVLHTHEEAVVIDVGGEPHAVLEYLQVHALRLQAILITHLHFDHIYGVHALQKACMVPVYTPEGDAPIANTEASLGGIWGFPLVTPFESQPLSPGDTTFAGMPCRVLSTPGHTPGGLSYYFPEEKVVFSGDALFYGSVGRTDFPLGNEEQLISGIRANLFSLPDETRVFPGHGPETSIGFEKTNNPICGEFARG